MEFPDNLIEVCPGDQSKMKASGNAMASIIVYRHLLDVEMQRNVMFWKKKEDRVSGG